MDRSFDVGVGHFIFLGQGVGEYRHVLPVKEIQNPVVRSASLDPQLMNLIPQIIGRRPAQLVPNRGQPMDCRDTVCICDSVAPA